MEIIPSAIAAIAKWYLIMPKTGVQHKNSNTKPLPAHTALHIRNNLELTEDRDTPIRITCMPFILFIPDLLIALASCSS